MSDAPNNISKLLTAICTPIQDCENALQQLLTQRALDTAQGAQLDALGVIVGQPRNGLDDDTYRLYLRARIATNRSNGTTENLIQIVSLIVNDSTIKVTVTNEGTATVRVAILSTAITDALAVVLNAFMQAAKSAGVRLVFEWTSVAPIDDLIFDSAVVTQTLDAGIMTDALG